MDNDNIRYGSLFGMFAAAGGAAALYFGGSQHILWLCIVGFVLAALGLLIAYTDTGNGIVATAVAGAAFCLYFFGKDKLLTGKMYTFNSWSASIAAWVAGEGVWDVFFIARILMIAATCVTVYLLIRFLQTHLPD